MRLIPRVSEWHRSPVPLEPRIVACAILRDTKVLYRWPLAAHPRLWMLPTSSLGPVTCQQLLPGTRCDQSGEPLLGSSCSMFLDNSRLHSLSRAAMPQEQDWGLPSGPVHSNTWHLSDASWNARVSARPVCLLVPVTTLSLPWVLFSKRKMATRPEVPKETLDPSVWRLVSARPWAYTENVIILEARTLLFAGRHTCGHAPPSRLLFLVDSVDLGLAARWGRS